MTYYIKGGSKYNEANPKVWTCLYLGGFADSKYLDTNWKDINYDFGGEGSVVTAQDPFWRLGGSSGGVKEVQLGLWDSYRIKINNAGVYKWIGPGVDDFEIIFSEGAFNNWIDRVQSSGHYSGGEITDDGDGTITVAAGSGYIKTTDSPVGTTIDFNWAVNTSLVLIDNDINYIYVDYSGGTPVSKTTTDRDSIEENRMFTLGKVYKSGTTLHIVNSGVKIYNFLRREHERTLDIRGFEHASGGIVSETGTRNIATTEGVFYLGLNKITTSAQDTSGTDKFTYWYRDGGGGWTKVIDQTQINNANYDDGDGTLGVLTANRYGVHWVYIHYDSDLHVIYGRGDYKLADAENATSPNTCPEAVCEFGTIVAKIIIQKNSATFNSVASLYEKIFPVSYPPEHNDLGELQGGIADEYYHLTNAQHGALHATYTDAEAVAAVVAADNYIKNNASDIMNGDLTVNNLITAGNVDGKDVSGLCTTAEAHAHVEATALTLTEDLTTENIVLGASYGLQLDGTPADDTYTGIILMIDTTGCAVGDAVYVDGTNSVLPADADGIATMPAIGICVAAGKVLTHGIYRDDSVLALATASKVYISCTAGDLTTTAPSGNGDIVQVFGITVGADMIFVNPSLDWVEVVV